MVKNIWRNEELEAVKNAPFVKSTAKKKQLLSQ